MPDDGVTRITISDGGALRAVLEVADDGKVVAVLDRDGDAMPSRSIPEWVRREIGKRGLTLAEADAAAESAPSPNGGVARITISDGGGAAAGENPMLEKALRSIKRVALLSIIVGYGYPIIIALDTTYYHPSQDVTDDVIANAVGMLLIINGAILAIAFGVFMHLRQELPARAVASIRRSTHAAAAVVATIAAAIYAVIQGVVGTVANVVRGIASVFSSNQPPSSENATAIAVAAVIITLICVAVAITYAANAIAANGLGERED